MAQVELNEDSGSFDAVIGDEIITNESDFNTLQDLVDAADQSDDLEENTDVVEDQENILGDLESSSVEDTEETETSEDTDTGDYSISPYSTVDTDYSFSPQNWQLNLAASRQLGEHYLMYGVRQSSSSYSGYWDYYLILGHDIEYDESNDLYTYTDCDLYRYSSYDGYVTYELLESSGNISGTSNVVYSDLYFDYVGVDPAANSYPYITFVLFVILMIVIVIGGRKNV